MSKTREVIEALFEALFNVMDEPMKLAFIKEVATQLCGGSNEDYSRQNARAINEALVRGNLSVGTHGLPVEEEVAQDHHTPRPPRRALPGSLTSEQKDLVQRWANEEVGINKGLLIWRLARDNRMMVPIVRRLLDNFLDSPEVRRPSWSQLPEEARAHIRYSVLLRRLNVRSDSGADLGGTEFVEGVKVARTQMRISLHEAKQLADLYRSGLYNKSGSLIVSLGENPLRGRTDLHPRLQGALQQLLEQEDVGAPHFVASESLVEAGADYIQERMGPAPEEARLVVSPGFRAHYADDQTELFWQTLLGNHQESFSDMAQISTGGRRFQERVGGFDLLSINNMLMLARIQRRQAKRRDSIMAVLQNAQTRGFERSETMEAIKSFQEYLNPHLHQTDVPVVSVSQELEL